MSGSVFCWPEQQSRSVKECDIIDHYDYQNGGLWEHAVDEEILLERFYQQMLFRALFTRLGFCLPDDFKLLETRSLAHYYYSNVYDKVRCESSRCRDSEFQLDLYISIMTRKRVCLVTFPNRSLSMCSVIDHFVTFNSFETQSIILHPAVLIFCESPVCLISEYRMLPFCTWCDFHGNENLQEKKNVQISIYEVVLLSISRCMTKTENKRRQCTVYDYMLEHDYFSQPKDQGSEVVSSGIHEKGLKEEESLLRYKEIFLSPWMCYIPPKDDLHCTYQEYSPNRNKNKQKHMVTEMSKPKRKHKLKRKGVSATKSAPPVLETLVSSFATCQVLTVDEFSKDCTLLNHLLPLSVQNGVMYTNPFIELRPTPRLGNTPRHRSIASAHNDSLGEWGIHVLLRQQFVSNLSFKGRL